MIIVPAIYGANKDFYSRKEAGLLTIEDVRGALIKNPNDRTDREIDSIVTYIQSLNDAMFAKIPVKELKKLCSISLWFESYPTETLSDDSVSCHLILTGAVGIWIKSADTSDLFAQNDDLKLSGAEEGLSGLILGECVSALRAGGQKQSFGEQGLLENLTRNASIRAEMYTETLMIDKQAFDLVIRKSYNLEIEDKFNYLRSFELLSSMNDNVLKKFATYFSKLNFSPRQTVYSAGESSNTLYFIVLGECEIVHFQKEKESNEGHLYSNNRLKSANSDRVPTSVLKTSKGNLLKKRAQIHSQVVDVMNLAGKKNFNYNVKAPAITSRLEYKLSLRKFVLSVLSSGSLLGADTALTSQNKPHVDTAIASTTLTVYAVNYVDFFRRIGPKILSNLKRLVSAQLYLRSERLNYLLQANTNLATKFEKDIVDLTNLVPDYDLKSKKIVPTPSEILQNLIDTEKDDPNYHFDENMQNTLSLIEDVVIDARPPTKFSEDEFYNENKTKNSELIAKKSRPVTTKGISSGSKTKTIEVLNENINHSISRSFLKEGVRKTAFTSTNVSNILPSPAALSSEWWNANQYQHTTSHNEEEWEKLLASYESELWALDHLIPLQPDNIEKSNRANLNTPLLNKLPNGNKVLLPPSFFITEPRVLLENPSDFVPEFSVPLSQNLDKTATPQTAEGLEMKDFLLDLNELGESTFNSYSPNTNNKIPFVKDESILQSNLTSSFNLNPLNKSTSSLRLSRSSSSFLHPILNSNLSSTVPFIPAAPSLCNFELQKLGQVEVKPLLKSSTTVSLSNSSSNLSSSLSVNIEKEKRLPRPVTSLSLESLVKSALSQDEEVKYSARTLVNAINYTRPTLGVPDLEAKQRRRSAILSSNQNRTSTHATTTSAEQLAHSSTLNHSQSQSANSFRRSILTTPLYANSFYPSLKSR